MSRDKSIYATVESRLLQAAGQADDGDGVLLREPPGKVADSFRFDDYDVRKGSYWSIFAGGHGFSYGCNEIFGFYRDRRMGYIRLRPLLPSPSVAARAEHAGCAADRAPSGADGALVRC